MSATIGTARSKADRTLFAWAAAVTALIAVGGFARTYYLKTAFGTPPLPALIHLHAALMTSWVALFVVQTRFIAAQRTDLHRRLGMLGASKPLTAVRDVSLRIARGGVLARTEFGLSEAKRAEFWDRDLHVSEFQLLDAAREAAEEKVLDALGYGSGFGLGFRSAVSRVAGRPGEGGEQEHAPQAGGREKARAQLRAGTLDDDTVEIELTERPATPMPFMAPGMEDMAQGLQDMMSSIGNNPIVSMLGGGPKKRKRKLPVKEALELLTQEEAARLVDMERVVREALDRAQNAGIVFIDEIDKIAGRDQAHGPDVSRGGVQRDLLPIVEGSNVNTKYGAVKTDHVLFIAAGAFHVSKVSDLIPELQGRFPIRVELEPLSREDLVRILKEPRNSLVRQYTALLATEGVDVQFRDDAVEEVARVCAATGLTLGQLHAMAAAIAGPSAKTPGLEKLRADDLPRLVQCAKELHGFARFWTPASIFRPRRSGQRRASFGGGADHGEGRDQDRAQAWGRRP